MNYINVDYQKCVELLRPRIDYYKGIAVYVTQPQDTNMLPYSPDGYVSSLLEKGWVEGYINGEAYHVEAPAIIFMPRKQIIEETRHSNDRLSTQLFLSNEFVEQLMIPNQATNDRVILKLPYYPLTQKQLTTAQNILDTIRIAIKSEESNKDRYIKALIEVWVFNDDIQQFHSQVEKQRINETVEQFLILVKDSAIEHNQVDYYATIVCKSPSQLERLVKQHTGKTIHQWIDYYKIEYCKQRLVENKISIAQLSEEIHFSSPEYLCRYFRQKTELSPSEYRKSNLQHKT